MATETNQTTTGRQTDQNALTLGLAFLTYTGFALMALALAIGVIQGDAADSGTITLMFTGGLVLFAVGLIAWLSVVRPWEKFDDLTEPEYHGHIEAHPIEEPGEVNVDEDAPPQATTTSED